MSEQIEAIDVQPGDVIATNGGRTNHMVTEVRDAHSGHVTIRTEGPTLIVNVHRLLDLVRPA